MGCINVNRNPCTLQIASNTTAPSLFAIVGNENIKNNIHKIESTIPKCRSRILLADTCRKERKMMEMIIKKKVENQFSCVYGWENVYNEHFYHRTDKGKRSWNGFWGWEGKSERWNRLVYIFYVTCIVKMHWIPIIWVEHLYLITFEVKECWFDIKKISNNVIRYFVWFIIFYVCDFTICNSLCIWEVVKKTKKWNIKNHKHWKSCLGERNIDDKTKTHKRVDLCDLIWRKEKITEWNTVLKF